MKIEIRANNRKWVNTDGSQSNQVSDYIVELTRGELGVLVEKGIVTLGNIFIQIEKEK